MKTILSLLICVYSLVGFAQTANVDIKLKPAGSFKVKSNDVKGMVTQKGDAFEAANIVVGLTKVETGIGLRDEHTRKHLEVQKFPEAVLVSAKGKGGQGEGIVKIHGVEKKVSGAYTIEGNKLVAVFPIKLSDFNITGIKYMGVGVDDNANITVSVPVKK